MPYSSMKNTTENNIMTLMGNGQVTAVPDIAIIRLGVQTTGDNLTDAQAENARLSQAVLQSLRQLGITEIKTYQYTINQEFDFQDGNRIDRGYSVRNIFEIESSALEQVGTVIDTAVYYGANVVDFMEFEVSNKDEYYLQALNLAVMDAYQKAKSIAESLDIMMNPIPTRITENSTPQSPPIGFALREGATTTPIESGSKQIEASVTVEFIY